MKKVLLAFVVIIFVSGILATTFEELSKIYPVKDISELPPDPVILESGDDFFITEIDGVKYVVKLEK